MKTIITAILLFLISFNASAVTLSKVKNKDGTEEYKSFIVMNDKKVPIKEASKRFWAQMKKFQVENKPEKVIFVPSRIITCSNLEALKIVRQRVISSNNNITARDLPLACHAAKHTSYAFSLKTEGDNYVKLIYSVPFDDGVDSGWFFSNQLMTAKEREGMRNS